MTLERFTLDALTKIDAGRIGVAFSQALRRCEVDCEDRPALSDSRKIVVTVNLTPVADDDGSLDSVNVSFHIKDNLPTRKSREYSMQTTSGRGLVYNDLSPEDARQATLDDSWGDRPQEKAKKPAAS